MNKPAIREAFRFFLERNGCVDRHAVVALSQAQDERAARELGLVFEWVPDDDPDLSWLDDDQSHQGKSMADWYRRKLERGTIEILGLVVKSADGDELASLWGIDLDTSKHHEAEAQRRQFEADLAGEALIELHKREQERCPTCHGTGKVLP